MKSNTLRIMDLQKAQLDINDTIIKLIGKYKLSYGELLYVISQISSSWSNALMKLEQAEEKNKENE